jgi:hypothetical protein
VRAIEVGKPEEEKHVTPAEMPWEEPLVVPDFTPAKPVELPEPGADPVKTPVKVPA